MAPSMYTRNSGSIVMMPHEWRSVLRGVEDADETMIGPGFRARAKIAEKTLT